MLQNNRRFLDDLSEKHDTDMQQLEADLEHQYKTNENDISEKYLSLVEHSDETT